jgi:arylsulfatase A-like enzyme
MPHRRTIDDYGWNDVSFHVNSTSSANPNGEPTDTHTIRTPSLAQLAREGVRLEAYYVQPVCSPTRGAILTGRYPSHTGIGPNVIPPAAPYGMPAVETLLPELLTMANFSTAALGKWCVPSDSEHQPTARH